MKSKQEVIQEAWGKYWTHVKDHVDENGKLKHSHCWKIFGDGINSDRNFYENELEDKSLNLQNCEWDMAYYPKAIEGLSNNNGWTRIESEADIPKEITECYVYDDDGDISCFTFGIDDCSGLEYLKEQGITHYKPIIKPEAPIY